jgi:TPR repeat protein
MPPIFDRLCLWHLRRRAERGHGRSRLRLADRYAAGHTLPRDHAAARHWYRLAAEQGVSEAQFRLGFALSAGLGGPPDLVGACAWFDIAIATARDSGLCMAARKGRAIAAVMMTPEQVHAARCQAEEWMIRRSGGRFAPASRPDARV